MKTMTKVVLSSAVLAGAASAAHAATTPVPLPSTDASELIFVVKNTSTGAAYDLVLSQTVGNGTGSYFNTTDATTAGPVAGTTLGTINGETGFSLSLSSDTALQSFITAAGTNIQWGIYGGAYSGAIASQREAKGATLIVTTGTNATILPVAESNMGSAFQNGLNTDIAGLNGGTFDSSGGVTSGFMTSAGSINQNFNLYGSGVAQASTSLGSTLSLYGITGNGSGSGQTLGYLLGTATFNGTTLAFTGNGAAVPLPAAAWLFGSGLLGLLGISRRRGEAVAA